MEDCFFALTLLLANLSLFISVLFKAGVLSRCLHGVLHSCAITQKDVLRV